jgi:hypothetical protein
MTLSQPIEDRSGTRHSRWFVTSNARLCHACAHSQPIAPQMQARRVQLATSFLRARQRFAPNRSLLSLRAHLFQSHAAVKSP